MPQPIYIEFSGQDEGLKAWLSQQIMYYLQQEIGIEVTKAFPMDEVSNTIKVIGDE